MRQRARKFIGTLLLLATLGVYLPAAMLVGANQFAHAHALMQVVYFLIAGLLWVIPAGLLIRWMQRPDPQ